MGPLFNNRAEIVWKVPARERLVNIGIRPSAISIKNETGCKAGDKCLFPHYKVDEQPNKKPKKCYFQKKRNDDKNAVAIVKSVSQFGCVSQESDALVSQGRKSWNQFKGYDSLSLRSVMRVSVKRKDHRWEQFKSKIISEVLTLWKRTSPMKKLEDSSDVPEARRGISKKKTRLHSTFPAEERVLPAASTKESEET